MFCEDAARRVAVLANDPHIARYDATVAHYESLHPHDAVAGQRQQRLRSRLPDVGAT